jgi:hypothetical protein
LPSLSEGQFWPPVWIAGRPVYALTPSLQPPHLAGEPMHRPRAPVAREVEIDEHQLVRMPARGVQRLLQLPFGPDLKAERVAPEAGSGPRDERSAPAA